MANKYLKGSRLTEDEFLMFLQLFVEDRTAVSVNKILKDKYAISYTEDSINKVLNRIKNSLSKSEYMSSSGFRDSKQKLIHEYKIPLGRNVKDDTEIQEEVFWVTFLNGRIHMEEFSIVNNHLTKLVRLLKMNKDQELNFNCHGLITKEGIKELYSYNDDVGNFIQFHKLRVKKHNGVNDINRINYFYESVIRYNFPNNSMFEFLKHHLQKHYKKKA